MTSFCGTCNNNSNYYLVDDNFILWENNAILKWCFDLNFPEIEKDNIRELIFKATSEWGTNEIGIRFEENQHNYEIICIKKVNNLDQKTLGVAFRPSDVDREILLTDLFFSCTQDLKYLTIQHEIGHILGFRHTFANLKESNEPSIEFKIPREISIMNYPPNCKFVEEDKDDLIDLYKKTCPRTNRLKNIKIIVYERELSKVQLNYPGNYYFKYNHLTETHILIPINETSDTHWEFFGYINLRSINCFNITTEYYNHQNFINSEIEIDNKHYIIDFLFDTGANISMISENMINRMNVNASTKMIVNFDNKNELRNVYHLKLIFHDKDRNKNFVEVMCVEGSRNILGMNFIKMGNFKIENGEIKEAKINCEIHKKEFEINYSNTLSRLAEAYRYRNTMVKNKELKNEE